MHALGMMQFSHGYGRGQGCLPIRAELEQSSSEGLILLAGMRVTLFDHEITIQHGSVDSVGVGHTESNLILLKLGLPGRLLWGREGRCLEMGCRLGGCLGLVAVRRDCVRDSRQQQLHLLSWQAPSCGSPVTTLWACHIICRQPAVPPATHTCLLPFIFQSGGCSKVHTIKIKVSKACHMDKSFASGHIRIIL